MEAGIKVHVARSIALSAGVEGAVIFPRHMSSGPGWEAP